MAWRGIPYATPPIGDLRFRAPLPPKTWSGIRDGSRYGPIAPQTRNPTSVTVGRPGQSEDCLTLNVAAAVDQSRGLRPVMVWFHGGAFMVGSSAQSIYTGESLIERGDVVLVTVNHRLGALGYLDFRRYSTNGRVFDSNLGLRDQVAALQWVHDNIESFGGDPARVTIFGESAGAGAVTTLYGVPTASDLFAAGIAQSSPAASVANNDYAQGLAHRFVGLLGVDPDDAAAVSRCLVEATPKRLIAAMSTMWKVIPDAVPGSFAVSAAVVDGDFLPADPVDAFEHGSAARKPLLIGNTAREGTLFQKLKPVSWLPTNESRIEKMFQLTDPGVRDRILAAYPSYPDMKAMAEFAGDYVMGYPTALVADSHSRHAPVWVYRFDSSTRMLDTLGLGATHGTDISVTFGDTTSIAERLTVSLGGRAARRSLSRRIQDHWTSFAHNQAPLASWPNYDVSTRPVMIFDKVDHVDLDPFGAARREAWAGYRGWRTNSHTQT
jgi:para-nitrobenzyl esterase